MAEALSQCSGKIMTVFLVLLVCSYRLAWGLVISVLVNLTQTFLRVSAETLFISYTYFPTMVLIRGRSGIV